MQYKYEDSIRYAVSAGIRSGKDRGFMDLLTINHFKPHAGKSVRFKGTPYVLALDRVEGPTGPTPAEYKRESFVVIFRGSSKTDVMPAGIYDCEIEGGPTYSLHVMPMHTPRADCQEYQSVFN